MSDEIIKKKEVLYKIFKIQNNLNNDLVFYGYSNNDLNQILHKSKSNYINYCKENKIYNTIFKLFEKYSPDSLEIILLEECLKQEIKDKLFNYIKNDKNSVNIRYSFSTEDKKIRSYNVKNEWKKKNIENINSYNKYYYKNNIEKIKQYHQNIKEKLKEKKKCDCGKTYCFNRKAAQILHSNTKHHQRYLKSLELI